MVNFLTKYISFGFLDTLKENTRVGRHILSRQLVALILLVDLLLMVQFGRSLAILSLLDRN